MHRIEAELLIPGHGEPVRDGVVLLDGPVISYVGPAAGAPHSPAATVQRTETVMPGMWDCHGHFLGVRGMDLGRLPLEPTPLRAARSVRDLGSALDAGITSVREVGGLGVYLTRVVAEGVVDGPAIYAAGSILSITGGHADLHSYPQHWVEDFARHCGELRMADGPDECMRAVREQLRLDARLIKVCASGGVMSEIDHPIHQQFTLAELRTIVEVAGLAERVVAAHCHGKPGIMAALQAGVRTIEHGSYLDDEACDAMLETGAILVPTRSIVEDIKANLNAVPDYAAAKLAALADHHAQAVSRAIERGDQHVGNQRHRARAYGQARHDAPAGDRGGDGYGPADAWPAGTAQRAAGGRLRRRRADRQRRPAGRYFGIGPSRAHYRCLDRRPQSKRLAHRR
jgi:imidazolonepropionase-like amidohydrolase